ncbi:MATE family efflux transporter [Aureimonas fodinaquatilis]|uniref:Multidrug-efflux transporter n=1 Tax=Aureimonas fodinaquatilis TaxID=2565783 RepID=A0A5B0DXA4_9HYPH|nr:MATE family efflux transporter [Aureimonas fodinaquatilis]KAA0971103.1 MATE family efflux transporter [Aureimonas fodinaquatilis]
MNSPATVRVVEPQHSWSSNIRATLLLGLPLIGAQLAQMGINVSNTIMLGQLGAHELAAAVLGMQLFHIIWMFGSGFSYAVMPLAANAAGRGDHQAVRLSVHMGLWAITLYTLVMMVLLWNGEALLILLGQDHTIAAMAGDYMRVLQWSLLPQLVIMTLRSFLSAIERPKIVLYALLAGGALNILLNYCLIFGNFGFPALGMPGSGLATVVSMCCVAGYLAFYCRAKADLKPYNLLSQIWQPYAPAFREVVRLGWPIGATILAEVSMFAASSIMMGWLGPLPLAAHGIALQLASITFMIPLGLAGAATVRVGRAYGRHDALAISRAAWVAHGVGISIAALAALLFLLLPSPLIRLYIDPAQADAVQLVPLAISFLAIAAAFQLGDTVQVISSGILRGLKDTRVPMLLAIFSYWLVGIPAAYVLAFTAGWGGIGIWWGLAIGLTFSSSLMTMRYYLREKRDALLFGAA